jgi:hypothetical protein
MGIDNISSQNTRKEMLRLAILINLYQGKLPIREIQKVNDIEQKERNSEKDDT